MSEVNSAVSHAQLRPSIKVFRSLKAWLTLLLFLLAKKAKDRLMPAT